MTKGASAPNPDLLFVLTQKVSKKVKTTPASLEKLSSLILLTLGIAQVNLALRSLKVKLSFGKLKSSKLVEVR